LSFGEIMGLVAGLLTTGSFIPQVIRVYKLKSAHDISLLFSISFVVGTILWLAYGINNKLLPVIIWNALGFIFTTALLIAKIIYGKTEHGSQKKVLFTSRE
jgi:MtN3 and saliva related transmembrane protein